jgi:hypothetical protein
MIGGPHQALFGGNSTEDNVGMFGIRGRKVARGFQGYMDRLHGDLSRGQILSNQNIKVRNLAEALAHRLSPFPHCNLQSTR